MGWIKRNIVNFGLIAASVMLTYVFLDVVLYFTHYRSAIVKATYPQFYFVKDPELGLDIAKNFATSTHFFEDAAFPVWSNNMGCFDTDYRDEMPYAYIAGDSLAWGFVPFADTWGNGVQDATGIRTLKCGVTGGFGTRQQLLRTARHLDALAQSPELIIVNYTPANDTIDDANFPLNTVYNGYVVPNLAKDGVTEAEAQAKYALFDTLCTTERPAHAMLQRMRCFLSNHSVLYNLFRKRVRDVLTYLLPQSLLEGSGILAHQTSAPDRNSPAEYEKHLEAIIGFKSLADQKGAKLLFVLGTGNNGKLIEFLEGKGIAYLDLDPLFKEYSSVRPLTWPVDGHWNVAGNHLAGYIVSRYIIERGIIDVPDEAMVISAIESDMVQEFGTSTIRFK